MASCPAQDGIDREKLAYIIDLKTVQRGRISDYIKKYPKAKFTAGCEGVWSVKADVALPCATQNEMDGEAAKKLTANGVIAVGEGANMPCTPEAVTHLQSKKVLFGPGKATNAGGVAVSGLEMSQNSLRLAWTREEVDGRLDTIMTDLHKAYSTPPPLHLPPRVPRVSAESPRRRGQVRQGGRLRGGRQHCRLHQGGRRHAGPGHPVNTARAGLARHVPTVKSREVASREKMYGFIRASSLLPSTLPYRSDLYSRAWALFSVCRGLKENSLN